MCHLLCRQSCTTWGPPIQLQSVSSRLGKLSLVWFMWTGFSCCHSPMQRMCLRDCKQPVVNWIHAKASWGILGHCWQGLINASLWEGRVPDVFKSTVVWPLFKTHLLTSQPCSALSSTSPFWEKLLKGELTDSSRCIQVISRLHDFFGGSGCVIGGVWPPYKESQHVVIWKHVSVQKKIIVMVFFNRWTWNISMIDRVDQPSNWKAKWNLFRGLMNTEKNIIR